VVTNEISHLLHLTYLTGVNLNNNWIQNFRAAIF